MGLGETETPVKRKSTMRLWGMLKALCNSGSGGQREPHHCVSLNHRPLFHLIVLSKPERAFSMFKPVSAVGIDVVVSRHKKG